MFAFLKMIGWKRKMKKLTGLSLNNVFSATESLEL